MKRYTLDKTHQHPIYKNIFRLLKNGETTEAWVHKDIIDNISDSCEIRGGTFHDGRFYGGTFFGGEFFGGEFFGGRFHDGEFFDGTFYGGIFYDGQFNDGYLPLQIQGSKHFVNIPDGKNIKIGCKSMSPNEWKKQAKEIGKHERYTDRQIEEYLMYIEIASKMIDASNT